MKLSFDRNHQIFNCFRNSFRNALLCCCRSAEKVRCCKAFQGFCDRYARKFSRPPRYDRFDTSPCDYSVAGFPPLFRFRMRQARLFCSLHRSIAHFSPFVKHLLAKFTPQLPPTAKNFENSLKYSCFFLFSVV